MIFGELMEVGWTDAGAVVTEAGGIFPSDCWAWRPNFGRKTRRSRAGAIMAMGWRAGFMEDFGYSEE